MRTTTKTLAIAAVASLALCATATGEDLSGQWLIRQDMAIALGYWHQPGPCHSYTVETGPTPFLAETALFGCTQVWNVEVWQYFAAALSQKPTAKPLWSGDRPAQRRLEYLRWSCVLFTHEYGHTLGLSDESTDPHNVMYAHSWPGLVPVPGCRRAFG